MVALVLVTAVSVAYGIRLASDRLDASEPSIARLTDVPGLGIEPEDQFRDAVISAWESYAREEVTRACMAAEGHAYVARALTPRATLAQVAEHLGVHADDAASETAVRPGDRDLGGRAPSQSYERALYDESPEDIAFANEYGGAPDGRSGDFATGGCWGEGHAAVSRIWDIRSLIGAGYRQEAAQRRLRDEFADHRAAFLDCLRHEGADTSGLDVSRPRFEEHVDLAVAFEACQAEWKRLDDAAEASLIDDDRAMYEAHASRYAGILDRIRDDEGFRSFLWSSVYESPQADAGTEMGGGSGVGDVGAE